MTMEQVNVAALERDWNAERDARLLQAEKLAKLGALADEMDQQDGRASSHYAGRIREILEGNA